MTYFEVIPNNYYNFTLPKELGLMLTFNLNEMKKIKLNTNALKLKKEEISSLTNGEMKHVLGGNEPATGPCTTGTCPTDTCQTQDYTCVQTINPPCPTPTPIHSIAPEVCNVTGTANSCHHC